MACRMFRGVCSVLPRVCGLSNTSWDVWLVEYFLGCVVCPIPRGMCGVSNTSWCVYMWRVGYFMVCVHVACRILNGGAACRILRGCAAIHESCLGADRVGIKLQDADFRIQRSFSWHPFGQKRGLTDQNLALKKGGKSKLVN